MSKCALLSVSNKTDITDFAAGLVELGFEVISTGGTYKQIDAEGIPVTEIEVISGLPPDFLGGMIKTIATPVLSRIAANPEISEQMGQMEKLQFGDREIGLVCINFYPFEENPKRDNIDIGGPTCLRLAAKCGAIPVCDPSDYSEVLSAIREGTVPDIYQGLVEKVFETTFSFDLAIWKWLLKQPGKLEYRGSVTD